MNNEEMQEQTTGISMIDVLEVTSGLQTADQTAKQLVSNMISCAMDGTLVWSRNLTDTVENAVALLDAKISAQLREVLHHDLFRGLEGSWLGVHNIVAECGTGSRVKVRLIDYDRHELEEQFENAPAIDRSRFFSNVYQHEFGTAGGEPFGVLIGDFAFGYRDEDVSLLRNIAEVAAAAHAPFIASVQPEMFDYHSFRQFESGKPVTAGFESQAYAGWNEFRDSFESRYVALTLPRTLGRLPYGKKTCQIKDFDFEEIAVAENGVPQIDLDRDFVWCSSAYAYGALLVRAFVQNGWCTAVRGVDNGGLVTPLPNYVYTAESGEKLQICPTEVNLTDEREKELSDLGFLPLVHFKNSGKAAFLGGQSAHRAKIYDNPSDSADAAISARMPYTMATSRIAHYLKIMGRDFIGSSKTASEIQSAMNAWIMHYVNPNAIGNDAKAKYPLAEARVTVEEERGRPGSFMAVSYLRPWLQTEELNASLRMVAEIPG